MKNKNGPVIITQASYKLRSFEISYWDGINYRSFIWYAYQLSEIQDQIHQLMNEIARLHQEQLQYSISPIGALNYGRLRVHLTKMPK